MKSQTTSGWIAKHAVSLVIVLIICFVLFRPKTHVVDKPPQRATVALSGPEATKDTPQPATAPTASAPQFILPTTQQVADAQEHANGIAIYDTADPYADPSWGLPAELDNEKIKSLSARVQKMADGAEGVMRRSMELEQNLGAVCAPNVRQVIFDRLNGKGFKDKEIPLLWYKISKWDTVAFAPERLANAMEISTAYLILNLRIGSVQRDLIGGVPSNADILFVDAYETAIAKKTKELDEELPAIAEFSNRLSTELPESNIPIINDDSKQAEQH